jgi:hypothetical protein
MIHSRRGFLTGLVGLVAAPAVCKAEWLMPVKAIIKPRTASDIWALQQEARDGWRRYVEREMLKHAQPMRVLERMWMRDLANYKGDTITIRRPIAFTSS